MEFRRLRTPEGMEFEQAMQLYSISFPPHEQREAPSQRCCMGLEEYHFDLIYDNETWAGIILYWETETFLYVEHFCIFPELRGRNYGRRALECLGKKGKTIILEIDPPEDERSIRRKGFYLRAGFVSNPFPHVHPPYHAGNQGHPLEVLSFPEGLTEGAYQEFYRYLCGHVMGGAGAAC